MSSSALIPGGMGLSIHCGTTPLLLKAGILSYVRAIVIAEVPFRTAEVHSIAPQCYQALYPNIHMDVRRNGYEANQEHGEGYHTVTYSWVTL